MKTTDEVRLKADPTRSGVILHAVAGTVPTWRVAWDDNETTDHAESELELVPGDTTNKITGKVTGTYISARDVHGGIHFYGK